MIKQVPEYLDRAEPTRIPIEDFRFKQEVFGRFEREAGLSQGECLARALGKLRKLNSFNTAAEISKGAISYGSKREFEEGTTEQLVGCSSCGAMCTVVCSAREGAGPGTEDDPNVVISIAEAPQPNPWAELGNFSDCKIGTVREYEGAEALIEPHGLTPDQRQLVKIISGPID